MASVSDATLSDKDALKVKEWEIGMLQNEIAASQGISIRRHPPTGPPPHYVGPFEFLTQGDNRPRDILEEIVWHKDVEVSQVLLSMGNVFDFSLLSNSSIIRYTSTGCR